MKVTWKYAVEEQTNVPFRWAEKSSRAHSSTCPKKNKRQHTWARRWQKCIFSRQKCMGKGRRIIPAVAADLSFHLYMHKRTNKRQHRWAKCTKWARCAKLHAQYKTVLIWGEGTYIALTRCVDGEKETIIMGAAEVICCFFLEEKIHNRPEISEHVHTRVPEIWLLRCL